MFKTRKRRAVNGRDAAAGALRADAGSCGENSAEVSEPRACELRLGRDGERASDEEEEQGDEDDRQLAERLMMRRHDTGHRRKRQLAFTRHVGKADVLGNMDGMEEAPREEGNSGSTQAVRNTEAELEWEHAAVSGQKKNAKHSFAPQRSSLHIRNTVTFDFQPHVCKDYKETGYCTFGDACKFAHIRGDASAPLRVAKKSDPKASESSGCCICQKEPREPVQTVCLHTFCEGCALARFDSDSTCATCSAETYGIFNRTHRPSKRASKHTSDKDHLRSSDM
ncbi:Pre-mRNA-splicing factor CWC24 [Porphyridium purpureum]|uniref:Pre-mRNA-splicing factor CWC24 n=1 Tax=Porphyridium purpureum TaxID=35688 RepID=A0A5J4YSC1_PORPP|nr:Pre-mRNA-splicing factor CWC24 [Porphyridium purpureum]|eukprot:POR9462..scf236_6